MEGWWEEHFISSSSIPEPLGRFLLRCRWKLDISPFVFDFGWKVLDMPLIKIESQEDERLEPYRHLRTRNLTRYSQRFIAESRLLVQRLVASDYSIESILIDEDYWDESRDWLPDDVQVLCIPNAWIDELLGFQFHRGFLACGIRKPPLQASMVLETASQDVRWTGMMALGVQDPENLGVLLRTAAGMGIRDCFLGPGTADPLSRRVLRVSMGAALKLNLIDCRDLTALMANMEALGIQSIATSLQEPSIPLESFQRTGATMILLGNEAEGLPLAIQNRATHRVKIAMELGTDSLNVSVAGGIVMHYLRRLALD